MKFNDLQVQAGSALAECDGRIAKDSSLDLKIRAVMEDLSLFFPEYSGSLKLQGTATGNQENPGVDLVLEGSGLDIAGYSLNTLQGKLDADLVMEGKESGMKINELKLLLNEAMSLGVTGQIGWAEGISWQTELHGEQLNPGILAAEWPGTIHTKIRSQGVRTAENLVAKVQLDELNGTLRDLPLAGSGTVEINGKKINIEDLHLQSGTTQLDVDGQADEEKLHFTLQARSDDLSPLVPGIQGGFEARAEALGDPTRPVVTLALSGSELAFQEYTLQQLQTNLKAALVLQGENQGAKVDDLRLVLNKKSTLAASGQIGWADGLSWQVDLSGNKLDPGLFLPEWSGEITTTI
ncbi:MAG: hypothetical protein D3909_19395, partial [Candidatus Electrothrix sp. ATG1]|nr:hypothetical protein [Candidatus Electrothrix sp. ATG1]